MRVLLYVRVSKDDTYQSTERQVLDLREFAKQQNWTLIEHPLAPDGVISEHMSGTRTDRPGIKRVLEIAKSRCIDKVLVHEASRFGRRLLDSLINIEKLTNTGVSLYVLAQNQETLDAKGKRTLYAKAILPLVLILAEEEVETHRERIISGIRAKRERNGGKVRNPDTVLNRPHPKQDLVFEALKASMRRDGTFPYGHLRKLSKSLNVSERTLYTAKKALIASGQ